MAGGGGVSSCLQKCVQASTVQLDEDTALGNTNDYPLQLP